MRIALRVVVFVFVLAWGAIGQAATGPGLPPPPPDGGMQSLR